MTAEFGATHTMRTNHRAELKQRIPIKCQVQSNEISTCLLTGDEYATMASAYPMPLLKISAQNKTQNNEISTCSLTGR